jgi:uncharacterized membrane protein
MEYTVSTAVAAPPDEIWRLFVDVQRWPQMTQSISDVRLVDGGPLRVGSRAVIKQPGLPRARWQVTELEPGRSFTWQTAAPGWNADGVHLVEPDEAGSKVTLILRMSGPLAGILHAMTRRISERNVTMELAGFKRTAEESMS